MRVIADVRLQSYYENMPQSLLRFVRTCAEHLPEDRVLDLPRGLRGIYVLYKSQAGRSRKKNFEVVYIGMAWAGSGGIRTRLRKHRRSKHGQWTHFSVFEVWDNIRDEEIRELEGLFRHIYKRDSRANTLNAARGFKPLRKLRNNKIRGWPRPAKRSPGGRAA